MKAVKEQSVGAKIYTIITSLVGVAAGFVTSFYFGFWVLFTAVLTGGEVAQYDPQMIANVTASNPELVEIFNSLSVSFGELVKTLTADYSAILCALWTIVIGGAVAAVIAFLFKLIGKLIFK